MKKKKGPKFIFDIDFQKDILRYIIHDKNGYQVLSILKPEYFELIEHYIICQVLKRHYRKEGRILNSKSLFQEHLKKIYRLKTYRDDITQDLKNSIRTIVNTMFKSPPKGGEDIKQECVKFASFVELNNAVTELDLQDFDNYETFSKRIRTAINIGTEYKENKGTFLINDVGARTQARANRSDIYPLPFKQLNRLTNAHGYQKGAVFVVIDKEKAFKTLTLVNLARTYLSMKKNVIVFDLENGEDQYSMRTEQSIIRKTKLELLSGDYNAMLRKTFRRYKRLGMELVIKRLPARSTTNDFQKWIDYYYREFGLQFDYAIIDYIGKMAPLSGNQDETQAISDSYVDVQNWALKNNIIHTWTGHHVVRAAYKRRKSVYLPEDTAKCIDINRHVDAIFGLQQTYDEIEKGILRMEIVTQRDGVPSGRAFFHVQPAIQRIDEFTRAELEQLYEQMEREGRPSEQPENLGPRKTSANVKDL